MTPPSGNHSSMFWPPRAFSLCVAALLACCSAVEAADDAVSVTAQRNPVDKSYRNMISGMERFEKRHAMAPDATLRFKLLPRNRETRMENVELAIVGDS